VLKANLNIVQQGTPYPKLIKGSKAYVKYNSKEAKIESIKCKDLDVKCTFSTGYLVVEYITDLDFLYLMRSIEVISTNKGIVISSVGFVGA
jgi:hypothetical protein